MEDIFKDLQKQSKNDVENLLKWIQDSKLIEATKEGEAKARALFADVPDPKNIDLDKFKQAVTQLAAEQNKTFEDISKKLAEEGSKLIKSMAGSMAGGVAAIKDVFTGGSKK